MTSALSAYMQLSCKLTFMLRLEMCLMAIVNRLMQAAAADLLGHSTTYLACQVAQIATYSADNSRSRSACHIISAIALYLG